MKFAISWAWKIVNQYLIQSNVKSIFYVTISKRSAHFFILLFSDLASPLVW